jgi:hypothetical protein
VPSPKTSAGFCQQLREEQRAKVHIDNIFGITMRYKSPLRAPKRRPRWRVPGPGSHPDERGCCPTGRLEPGEIELHVGVLPGLLEFALDALGSFGLALRLLAHALSKKICALEKRSH